MTMSSDFTHMQRCDLCGRPSFGQDRCPHAINKRYACPYDKARKDRQKRMRHIGRWM